MRISCFSGAALLLLAGCTAGLDYAGPPELGSAASPSGKFVRGGGAVDVAAPSVAHWWTSLGDPVLDDLQARALAGNPTIAVAQARVRQARSSVRLERANRLPQVAATGMYAHAELPGVDLGSAEGASGGGTSLDFLNLGLNANWELEFAGGQRRTIEAANAQAAAAEASVGDAQVQLTGDVAQAYVNLRHQQGRLTLLRQQGVLQDQMLELAEQRFARGTTAAFEVEQGRTARERTAVDIVAAETERDIYLNALAVLTGSAPGNLDALLAAPSDLPLPPAQVSVGDPGALLQRRPDIRAAERSLAAATAGIGRAEAARYPRISFLGILGMGGAPEDLDLGNISAIALPQIQWSLFDGGRTTARVKQAEASRDEAEAQYRQVVLAALQDAENALARFGRDRQTVASMAIVLGSAQRTSELMNQRFQAGVVTGTQRLEAERQALVAEQNLIAATANLTGSYVAVQKSLGLGWSEPLPISRDGAQ